MNVYDFYITPAEYEEAEKNGICRSTLEKRIRWRGWDKRRALTQPPDWTPHKDWAEVAAENGIKYKTYIARVYRGMSEEQAATKPVISHSEAMIAAHAAKSVIPASYRQAAIDNGIKLNTFYNRLRHGWKPERASTEPPVITREQKGQAQ